MERDMTVGSPAKMIINFTLPIFLGNVFQQLYNTVDSIIVGNYIGSEALAAVGSSGSLINLLIGFVSELLREPELLSLSFTERRIEKVSVRQYIRRSLLPLQQGLSLQWSELWQHQFC